MQWLREVFPLKPVRCPNCRLKIDGRHVWNRLNCPACRAVFKIPGHYVWTVYALALSLSAAAIYAVGIRRQLPSLTLLLGLPTARAMLAVNRRLFPPDLEVVDAGWTPGDSEIDQLIEGEFERLRGLDATVGPGPWDTPPPALGEWKDDTPGRSPFAPVVGPPVTVEGVLLVLAFVALLAYNLYVAFRPTS